MPEAEAAGWEALLIRRRDGSTVLDVGRVHVRGKRRDERVEHVGGEGDEWWQGRERVREGYLEAENGGGIGA
jgi:hypothetical protein